MTRGPWFLAVLALCTCTLAGRSAEPLGDLWSIPEHTVAWWIFDPRAIGGGAATEPGRALAEAGLRALLNHIMPTEDGPSSPAGFITPGLLRNSPYRLCLLELETEPAAGRPGPDRAARIIRLVAVLEIRTRGDKENIAAAVRSALRADAKERSIDLPGGLRGTASLAPGFGPAAQISWCSIPGVFLVGFGEGALERWLDIKPMLPDAEPSLAREQIARRRSQPDLVLEAGVDLNALRRAAPEQFAYGRIGRLAEAWRLANARTALLSARLMPVPPDGGGRFIVFDIALSSRAERPGAVHSMPITEDRIPPEIVPQPAAAPYAVAIRSDWGAWIGLALDTWAACAPRAGADAAAAQTRWMRLHHSALERLNAQTGKWVVIRAGGSGIALDGQLQLSQKPRVVESDLREVFGSLGAQVQREATGVWNLTLTDDQTDPDHLLRHFFWSLSRDGTRMIGAWNRETVEATR